MRNSEGARAATAHLLSMGRRRILALGAHRGEAIGSAGLRLEGYAEALADAGVPFRDELVVEVGGCFRSGGAEAMRGMLRSGIQFDGVVAFNDSVALGAMRVMQEAGLQIPRGVSIIGFGDIDETQSTLPTVSTINPGNTWRASRSCSGSHPVSDDAEGATSPPELDRVSAILHHEGRYSEKESIHRSRNGGGAVNGEPTNCTNKIVDKSAPVVSVWAWNPNMAKVVDNFNNNHKDVQVCWTVAGPGAPEYTEYQTAISADKGASDVIMLKADQLTGFEIQKALVDLSACGATEVRPMALIYRKDIFDKYGITTPPTTRAEYAADAQKGAKPFTYDCANAKNVTIDLASQPAKDVLDYWADLSKKGLVGKGTEKGQFAVATLPQWDTSNPVSVNWHGSTFAVTSQASDKKLSAIVAKGLYADDASLTDGWKTQTIFPLNQGVLKSDAFVDHAVDFFNGQRANKDIYLPAENVYRGVNYSPFSVYCSAQLQAEIVKISAGKISGSDAAIELQATMVTYAKHPGFTVK